MNFLGQCQTFIIIWGYVLISEKQILFIPPFPQNCLSYSGTFVRILILYQVLKKNLPKILIGIALNLWIRERNGIFTI